MHLAMITAYFIEHMFGFSQKQKAGSSQMVPALLSLILIFIIQYYDVRGKSPDFDAYELFRATHSRFPLVKNITLVDYSTFPINR